MTDGEGLDLAGLVHAPVNKRPVSSCNEQLKVRDAGSNRSSGRVSDERDPVSYFDFRSFLREYAGFHATPLPDGESPNRNEDLKQQQCNRLTPVNRNFAKNGIPKRIVAVGASREPATLPPAGSRSAMLAEL